MNFKFNEVINIRLYSDEVKSINKIIGLKRNRDKYGSKSHFIRCAIIKLIREEKTIKKGYILK